MKIIFQNQYFVAVDKEPGFLSVPARQADDPRPVLGRLLQEQLGQQIYPVHRLDAEVSGLVLYALTPEAHAAANTCFEDRQVQKTYQAFSSGGSFEVGAKGLWKAKLLRGKKRAYESPVGKLAVTGATLLASPAPETFEWKLEPQTGRSHQLRWELFRHGSSILGDVLYGSSRRWNQGIALRSVSLVFAEEFTKRFGLPSELGVETWIYSDHLSMKV